MKLRNFKTILRRGRYLILGSFFGKIFYLIDPLSRPGRSWSAYGEDVAIEGFLKRYRFLTGYDFNFSYIDIGCYEPCRSSNTFLFYRSGITGTAVDPNPYLKKLWSQIRPRDTFLPIACAKEKLVEFNIIQKDGESNTTSNIFLNQLKVLKHYSVEETIVTNALDLDEIISLHLEIYPGDFLLDIDIEGKDFELIENFLFLSGRPFILLVETSLNYLQQSRMEEILNIRQYRYVATLGVTSIFFDCTNNFAKVLNLGEL